MDNDGPNYRSRSDASRRLFGDDARDDTVTATEQGAAAPDRLFAASRDHRDHDDPGSRARSPFAKPSEDGAVRRAADAEPRFERPAQDPYRPAEARRDPDQGDEPRPSARPRSDNLFDSPRESVRERFGSPGSGSGLFEREEKPRSSVFPRDPIDPVPRPSPSRDWEAPATTELPIRGSQDRGFDFDRPARSSERAVPPPRIDRLGDQSAPAERRPSALDRAAPRAPAVTENGAANRFADRPSYADREPTYERDSHERDSHERDYVPPPGDRAYVAPPPRDQRDYYDPEPADQAPAYHGYHARELATVDEYGREREYEYIDESVDFRRAEPSGYEAYGQFDDRYGEFQEEPKRRGPFLLLGSLIGVAAIAGGLILVYKQGVREGQNDTVPVVSAPQDPAKVEPSEPGGIEVSGRTKLIYDRIIGETTVTDETIESREEPLLDPSSQPGAARDEPSSQQVEGGEPLPLPLPPPPGSGQQGSVDPSAMPAGGDAFTQAAVQTPTVPQTDPSIPSAVIQPDETGSAGTQPVAPAPPDPSDPIAQMLASPPVPVEKPVPPSRQAAPGTAVPTNPVEAAPLPGSVPREDTQTASADSATPAPINLQPGQPVTLQPAQPAAPVQPATQAHTDASRSIGQTRFDDEPGSGIQQPAVEPVAPQQAPANDAQVAAVEPQAVVSEQPITGGKFVVQLASFRTEQEAQAEFDRLRERHGSLLDNYSSFIQQADLGSRGIYYRLRIGPIEERGTASQLCNSLISAGERDCFVGER